MIIEEQLLELIKQKETLEKQLYRVSLENTRLLKELDDARITIAELREELGRKPRREFVEVNPPWGQ